MASIPMRWILRSQTNDSLLPEKIGKIFLEDIVTINGNAVGKGTVKTIKVGDIVTMDGQSDSVSGAGGNRRS